MILHGDCLEKLKELPDNSVDSIVTDPPYGLSFMGKHWDYDVPSVDIWKECLRVLKPGGHLLSFAGTRTQHRMAVNIEDAGFEIRDMIAWVYGSGFPKSLNIGKAIDGAERGEPQGGPKPSSKNHGKFKGGCSEENETGRGFGAGPGQFMAESGERDNRELVGLAKQWEGWGTALKPALEPITVARKPLIGTVAENVLTHGVGGLNIDGCRVPTDDKLSGGVRPGTAAEGWDRPFMHDKEALKKWSEQKKANQARSEELGRFPANLIHDGSEEVVGLFPHTKSGKIEAHHQVSEIYGRNSFNKSKTISSGERGFGDSGSAARFFYCAKSSRRDRNEGLPEGTTSTHPTVKPTDLMRYLCRLVTPKGGTVLDPFMGSGSTGKASKLEGFSFIGIEREKEYVEIARARIENIQSPLL